MGRQGAWQAGQRRSRQWRPQVAAVATAALVLPALVTMPTTADAAAPSTGSAAPAPSPTKVRLFTPTKDGVAAVARVKAEQTATAEAAKRALRDQARPTAWPASGVSTVAVPTSGTAVRTSPGALPITLSLPPAANATAARAGASVPVRVQVFDRSQAERAGVHGTLLSITPTAGSGSVGTAVSVDYAGIANAYGGDFGGRLQLVRLPGCALTTPEKAQCRTRIAMPFHNERRAEKLTTEVDLAGATATRPVLLALTAGTKSGGGDYKATPLSVSSSWQAGGSSGSFSWSYPLRVPPAAAGPSPNLNISYDSGSVDGRTASSNNQGSAVGEGFDITSSYVERKYISCDDDGNDDKQDLCWKYDNALLVLNGKSTELVLDDPDGDGKAEAGKPEVWRLKDDDASKVEHLTGADNGARGGEHWRITTGDGTQYSFGLEKLPGAAEKDRTQSVWTVPVFGDDDGEPCHGDTFDKSDCVQAWRWNLDYVVDTHDSAMSYWYTEELNYYAKNGKEKESGTPYERGGYLDRIEYGQRDKHLFDTGTHAPQKVVFTTEERCLQQCDKLTFDSKGNWPDVPFDAICEKSESCTGRTGPSFFTRRRLTDVTTYVWKTDTDAGTPGYQPVDSWKLDQSYLDPGDIGDASDQTLWLNSIVHSGRVGPDKELPPVTFTHEWKKNRVDKTDDILPLNKPRLSAITAETGAITTVTYSEEDCDAAPEHRRMPTAEDDVTLRCYPVKWRPHGGDGDPTLDWFHKYVVTDVVTTDPTGGSRPLVYHYAYDAPAWHYTEDPLTTPKERTWSQWRGYRTVTTLAGEANELTPSKTVTVYLQGMNRDRTSTGRRSVTVKGITAPPIADDDQLSGFARETVTYNGADEISGTINDPWIKQTALRHYSWLDVSANYVRTAATHVRTRVTSGAAAVQRTHTTTSSFDEYGMPVTVEDRGDDGKSGDETCTRTWYARNDTVGLTTLVGRARTLAVACSDEGKAKLPADSTTQGDVVSDSATAYDVAVWAAQQAPTKGDALWSGRASGYAADGTPTWQTVTTNKYDKLGRLTDATDVKLNKTHTAYIPAEGGPLVQTEVTNPKGFTTVTVVDPAWGVPTTTTDPNSKITKAAYDQFGRLSKVHLPDTSSVTGRSPNIVYEYHLSQADASWVSTSTLRGNNATQYNTRYEIFDALLRVRQTQTPSPLGGQVIGETFYDSRGQISKTYADIYDNKHEPTGQLYGTVNAQAPAETRFGYDGAARPISNTFLANGISRWSTTTSYTGDSVATTAPAGGSASRQFTDVFDRVTERRSYAGTSPNIAAYVATNFTYTPAGYVETVTSPSTGPEKATWTYRYDLFGRKTKDVDPDKGETNTGYTVLDQIEYTIDARKNKLIYDYDELGRKLHEWSGTVSDASLQAAWTYDEVANAKGQQNSATRYVGGLTGQAYTKKVTKFDALYRPTTTQLLLPTGDPLVAAGVPATLQSSTAYRVDGVPHYTDEPAVGGLPRESISYTYNNLGMPATMAGTSGYVLGTAYTPIGDLEQLKLGTSETNPKQVSLTNQYEPGTRRLRMSSVTDTTHSYKLQELTYAYDEAGNVQSISDPTSLGGTGKPDFQCFTYDGYRRVEHAWTPKTANCAPTARTVSNLDGAAPYWNSYSYSDAGLRKTETRHTTGGDVTTTYNYGENGHPPHALTSTNTPKTATAAAVANTYAYDALGNTINRPGPRGSQTLAWDAEGRLQAVSEPAAPPAVASSTGYLYDADGALLIRRPAAGNGETVLYLGATEVHLTTGATPKLTGTRYYSSNGNVVAVRTATKGTVGTKLSFLAGDHHATASLAINGSITNGQVEPQTYTKRYTTPFGAPRGPQAAWPDDKRFLGKPVDTNTGLTHVGAREYDPDIGRFISVDPVLDTRNAQSLNGYVYADNNPVTFADPTGLLRPFDGGSSGGCGGACQSQGDGSTDGSTTSGGSTSSGGSGGSSSGGSASSGGSTVSTSPKKSFMDAVVSGVGAGFGDFIQPAKDLYQDFKEAPLSTAAKSIWGVANSATPSSQFQAGWDSVNKLYGFAKAIHAGDAEQATRLATERTLTVTAAVLPMKVKLPVPKSAKPKVTPCPDSFQPGTLVLMADGATKPIRDVRVGDRVLATDPETGETVEQEVTELHDNVDHEFVAVKVTDDRGRHGVLRTTAHHPFWDETRGRWTDAGDLRIGHKLLTTTDRTARVSGLRASTGSRHMLNLTVANFHTYYVLAGNTPVLVHNCGGARFAVDSEGVATEIRPLGRGSTGRTVPESLNEKLAMDEAISNPAAGRQLRLKMTDVRWHADDGWVKMAQNVNGIEIHYVRNTITDQVDDFKFK